MAATEAWAMGEENSAALAEEAQADLVAEAAVGGSAAVAAGWVRVAMEREGAEEEDLVQAAEGRADSAQAEAEVVGTAAGSAVEADEEREAAVERVRRCSQPHSSLADSRTSSIQ